jgi:hypothetical protein
MIDVTVRGSNMEDIYYSNDFREKRDRIFSQFRASMNQIYLAMFTLDFDDLNTRLTRIVKRAMEDFGSDECSKMHVLCIINSFLLQEAIRRNMSDYIIRDYWDRFEFTDINEDVNFFSTRLIYMKYLIGQSDFNYANTIKHYLKEHLENDDDIIKGTKKALRSLILELNKNYNS